MSNKPNYLLFQKLLSFITDFNTLGLLNMYDVLAIRK